MSNSFLIDLKSIVLIAIFSAFFAASGNIGILIFFLPVVLTILFARQPFEKKFLLLLIVLVIFFPQVDSILSYSIFNLNFLIFIIFLGLLSVLIFHWKTINIRGLNQPIDLYVLALVIIACAVYLPILIETIFNLDLFNGVEEQFIANRRDSLMISFTLPFLAGVMTYITSRLFLKSISQLRWIFSRLLIISTYFLCLSYFSFFTKIELMPQDYLGIGELGNRMGGITMPDPNGFGRLLVFPIFFGLAMHAISESRKLKSFYSLLIVMHLIALYLTESRTFIFSTFVGLGYYFLFKNFNFKKLILLAPPFILAVIYINFLLGDRAIDVSEASSLSGRLAIWLAIISVLGVSPYVGLRPGGWIEYLEKSASFEGTILKVQSAHSLYLDIAINWGLIFTAIYILFFLVVVLRNHKLGRRLIDHDSKMFILSLNSILITFMMGGITEIILPSMLFLLAGLSISLNLRLNENSFYT